MMILKLKYAALAAVLCLNLPCTVTAEENPAVYINAGYGEENGIAEVALMLKGNSGISAYSVEVDFDPSVLSFVEAQQGDAINGGTFYCNGTRTDDSVTIVWSDSYNQSGNGTAAVLRFKTAADTAETDTILSLGHTAFADNLVEARFEQSNGLLKIAGEIKKGDVNCDGIVDAADIVAINMYLLNNYDNPLSYTAQANSEVTGDKAITADDSIAILNYATMIIKEL